MKLALLPAGLLKVLGAGKWLPAFARDALELIPDDCESAQLPELSPARSDVPKRGRVGFVSGCVMSVMFGRTNRASVQLLNHAGYDVVTPRNQLCCGALYAHTGSLEKARALARQNIEAFEPFHLETIVINAAGCGSTLKEYGHLLEADAAWSERARRFGSSVKDLTEVLATIKFPLPAQPWAGRVTYHDACHLAHPQRITRQPRELVRAVAGDQYVELPEADLCCGSAGSYNLTEPEMAARLQKRKVRNIRKTEALTVVTTNPGCILQMRAGLKKSTGQLVRVLHIAEFLLEALEARQKRYCRDGA